MSSLFLNTDLVKKKTNRRTDKRTDRQADMIERGAHYKTQSLKLRLRFDKDSSVWFINIQLLIPTYDNFTVNVKQRVSSKEEKIPQPSSGGKRQTEKRYIMKEEKTKKK